MAQKKKCYEFRGHILKFDKPYAHGAYYATYAVSQKQAETNIKNQAREKYGLVKSIPLTLIGEFTVREEDTYGKEKETEDES